MDLKLNQVVLFKNKQKKTPKQPDYTGTMNIEGVTRDFSMWAYKSKQGETFLSGWNNPPYQKKDKEAKPQPKQKSPTPDNTGGKAPF
jgi:hypothetical protein